MANDQEQQTEVITSDCGDGAADEAQPELAEDVELIGKMDGSGFKEPPALVRRADGQMIQLPDPLFVVAQEIERGKDYEQIAATLGDAMRRDVAADDVRYLVEEQLIPLGVASDGEVNARAPKAATDPLLGLRLKTAVIPGGAVKTVTTVFRPLFLPPVVTAVLLGLIAVCGWLFASHGLAQSTREVLMRPSLMLLILGLVIVSAAFHECGHATACRYGGATPGAMGVGVYIVWPAFYTDVTDAYRLDRTGRLRTDLGGLYFNSIFILVVAGTYTLTGFEPLLLFIPLQLVEMVHQLLPFLRLDGYYILADATGVPDMFGRIKPILHGLIPGREHDPRADELKRWARVVVTAWVVLLIPVLLMMFGLMAVSAPRVISTAWDSLGDQWKALGLAWSEGDVLGGSWAGFQAAVLALPAAGMITSFSRIGSRTARAAWRVTEDRPLARMAFSVGGVTAAAITALWLVGGNYTPIQPNERGTVADAAVAVRTATRQAVFHPTRRETSSPERHQADTGSTGGQATTSDAGSDTGTDSSGTTGTGGGSSSGVVSTPPESPSGLAADSNTPASITLRWSPPAEAAGIVVMRGDGDTCPASPSSGTQIGSQVLRSTQEDGAVADGATYCYAVFTLADDGTPSEAATITVTAAMPDEAPSSKASQP